MMRKSIFVGLCYVTFIGGPQTTLTLEVSPRCRHISALPTPACSPVLKFFRAYCPEATSFSPRISAKRTPSLLAVSSDFELESFVARYDDHALFSQLARQLGGVQVHACAEWSDVNIGGPGGNAGGFLQGSSQAVFTNGKADARRGRAAERFGKAVIASAAENRVLRAERAVRELEGRTGVVIQAAHQPVVDGERNVHGRKNLLHFGEVRAAAFVQIVGHARKLFDDRLVFRNFAVSTRSGFVSARRWQSEHMVWTTSFSASRNAWK